MGELVLKRVQAAAEASRGTALAATKKLYGGPITINRAQPNRYAVEDRGSFTDKFRGNKQLVESGFSWPHDVTFEDEPFYITTFLRGSVAATGTAATGYLWTFAPDTTSDTLGTMCLEAGDDSVAWQGPFATTDTADYDLKLTDAVTATLAGFNSDWVPQSSGALATSFAGFTPSLAERVVESVMGWQARLFIDTDTVGPGNTQITGRFIDAQWGYHDQNKRKYFGDAGIKFSRLGRGRRQVHCAIEFEALDTAQYADYYNTLSKAFRVGLYGSAITGTTFGTTSGVTNPGTVTSIVTAALTAAIPGGLGIVLAGQTFVVTPAGAASGATTIPVISQVVSVAIPSGTTVMAAKTALYDFWGIYDNFALGSRDTNTTFKFDVQAMYSPTAAKECQIIICNGLNAL